MTQENQSNKLEKSVSSPKPVNDSPLQPEIKAEIEKITKQLHYRLSEISSGDLKVEAFNTGDGMVAPEGWQPYIQGSPKSVLDRLQEEAVHLAEAEELANKKGYEIYQHKGSYRVNPTGGIIRLRESNPFEKNRVPANKNELSVGTIGKVRDWLKNEAPDLSDEKILAECASIGHCLVWKDPQTGNYTAGHEGLKNGKKNSDGMTYVSRYSAKTPETLLKILLDEQQLQSKIKSAAQKKRYSVFQDETGSWHAAPNFQVLRDRRDKGAGSLKQRKKASKNIPAAQQKIGSGTEVLAWLESEAPDLSE